MIFFYDSSIFKRKQLLLYLKIGINGMLMICFEWWALEFLAIFSGLISVRSLASQVVIIQFVALIFMIPLGISFSSSALVGSYLGELKIGLAKRFAFFTLVIGVLMTSVVAILIYFCPR
jgi:MATE family multidrug resistance protein